MTNIGFVCTAIMEISLILKIHHRVDPPEYRHWDASMTSMRFRCTAVIEIPRIQKIHHGVDQLKSRYWEPSKTNMGFQWTAVMEIPLIQKNPSWCGSAAPKTSSPAFCHEDDGQGIIQEG